MADFPTNAHVGAPDAPSLRRCVASPSDDRNVAGNPRQPRLPKAIANIRFHLRNEVVSTPHFLLRASEQLRCLRPQDRTVQCLIQLLPIGKDLGEEKCSLSKRLCRASKCRNFQTHIDNGVRGLQKVMRLLINEIEPVRVALAIQGVAELGDARQPTYQSWSYRNCNPHRTTTLVALPSTGFSAGQSQRGDDGTDRTDRRPGIPPNHTPSFSGRPTRTYSIPPAHSLIPLWTGRHSAMAIRPEAIAHG